MGDVISLEEGLDISAKRPFVSAVLAFRRMSRSVVGRSTKACARPARPLGRAGLLALALSFSSFALPGAAHAEPWLLRIEPSFMLPVSAPQADLFGPGLSGSVQVSRSLHRIVQLGLQLRAGFLFDGPEPQAAGFADPGIGTVYSAGLALRLRPFAPADDPRRGTHFFLEGVGGAALTGEDVRGMYEIGVGWGFEVGIMDIAPIVRFHHVIQQGSELDNRDALMLTFGLELAFLDDRPDPDALPEPEHDEDTPEEGDTDRDGDGIYDATDECPADPEDYDNFQDEDGCPEEDNDDDGLLDVDEDCPDDPEDFDGFEDDDGCPDRDNDVDGVLDTRDACPDEPETINGIDDEDGCPDEGLIEMINDRIVLEERVLFDFERARVKSAARPILEAIVNLVNQHPEWTRMRIEGHADVRGNEDYNLRLSERRARNVRRALVQVGIDGERLDSVGYGSSRPRDSGLSENAHQRNRRVEFVVVARTADGEGAGETEAGTPVMVFGSGGAESAPASDSGDAADSSSGAPDDGTPVMDFSDDASEEAQ